MALAHLHKRATGKLSGITAAPPRALLSCFGGFMSIDEYRKSNETSEWSTHPPKLVTFAQVVHDRKAGEHRRREAAKPVDLNSQIDLGPSSAAPRMESLRLKRPKPVKKTTNMLEIALGLVSKQQVQDP